MKAWRSDPYPCRAAIYDSWVIAEDAIAEAVAGLAQGERLIEQPFAYSCTEGHVHAMIRVVA